MALQTVKHCSIDLVLTLPSGKLIVGGDARGAVRWKGGDVRVCACVRVCVRVCMREWMLRCTLT
jgi:hypothetical protein